MLNSSSVELDSANFKINSLSSDLLQLSIKLNIVMKVKDQYERVQSKLQTEIQELRQTCALNDTDIRIQQGELVRLREEIASKVIDEEVLLKRLADNQIILEQTMNNYETRIKNLTISIEKQFVINETYYAYMVSAKKDYLEIQIEKSHFAESKRNYQMKYELALVEKNIFETKFNQLQQE